MPSGMKNFTEKLSRSVSLVLVDEVVFEEGEACVSRVGADEAEVVDEASTLREDEVDAVTIEGPEGVAEGPESREGAATVDDVGCPF